MRRKRWSGLPNVNGWRKLPATEYSGEFSGTSGSYGSISQRKPREGRGKTYHRSGQVLLNCMTDTSRERKVERKFGHFGQLNNCLVPMH
jgi:hypothetical protein